MLKTIQMSGNSISIQPKIPALQVEVREVWQFLQTEMPSLHWWGRESLWLWDFLSLAVLMLRISIRALPVRCPPFIPVLLQDSLLTYHAGIELVVVASGGPLTAGAVWTNAAPSQQFTTTVNAWEMIALTQGSIHYVFNDNCHQTVTVNAFGSEDPWILNVAPSLFKLNGDVLNGTLGFPAELNGGTPSQFLANIPPSYVLGSMACLKRCGIDPNSRYAPN